MCRRNVFVVLGLVAALTAVNLNHDGVAVERAKTAVKMLPSEAPQGAAQAQAPAALPADGNGITLEGFYPANIVRLKDGSLITEAGMQSTDGGRTWKKNPSFQVVTGMGMLRLPNGELGAIVGSWNEAQAFGNGSNNWFFRWSADEGKNWSSPVQITLDGLTMGLAGARLALRDGKRILVITYSQFLGSRFDKRGTTWGNYEGAEYAVETEGHFPTSEVCRVYYSDDNGRSWKPSDGWIMGWRDQRWTEAFTEADGVELKDGRIMLVGRALTGRVYQAFSNDRGHSWWPGAQPMALASSYSPARICRLPKTGDLMILWNQVSRAETRKGLRRSRLSCAVSKDEGKTWEHFKNLEAIESLAATTRVPPDPDLTPVWGDDQVGRLPKDFALFHYPNVNVVDNEVFISYIVSSVKASKNGEGKLVAIDIGGYRTRILPPEWFYR
jgi:hypothetical protein